MRMEGSFRTLHLALAAVLGDSLSSGRCLGACSSGGSSRAAGVLVVPLARLLGLEPLSLGRVALSGFGAHVPIQDATKHDDRESY